ncbi:hypothetical protein CH306_01200 [Rhodococcus sp. 15-725-2-2b]|jgi:uncharacterized protein (UPF0333 family)|uniref:hypothetical protein n=1 Tax=unclassified Rhodococcus (in: high G+C Gram-positive bacteria) TaxID=192944 RepID=UPI000B9AC55B|nr:MULTISPECIES: hypothetical protein [unclassified Rhodococcus (in: high G+C Gram-positive bacteria)]OZC63887.1 hypothetical protein CH277_20725 [Rhodococcus sp. 06-469-3-2]OZD51434.1 hypothetical protein CH264_00710 [Rhodococcus sp. 06-1477-1A]OZE78749.1 hypothetical protein CH306_01200 [Rhodococcus sp. 15-725-2-2b]
MTDKSPKVPPTLSALIAIVASCVVVYVASFEDSMSTALQVVLLLVGVLVAGGAIGYTIASVRR